MTNGFRPCVNPFNDVFPTTIHFKTTFFPGNQSDLGERKRGLISYKSAWFSIKWLFSFNN